jgi:hypothetical protein
MERLPHRAGRRTRRLGTARRCTSQAPLDDQESALCRVKKSIWITGEPQVMPELGPVEGMPDVNRNWSSRTCDLVPVLFPSPAVHGLRRLEGSPRKGVRREPHTFGLLHEQFDPVAQTRKAGSVGGTRCHTEGTSPPSPSRAARFVGSRSPQLPARLCADSCRNVSGRLNLMAEPPAPPKSPENQREADPPQDSFRRYSRSLCSGCALSRAREALPFAAPIGWCGLAETQKEPRV